jgi:hypothetical protein
MRNDAQRTWKKFGIDEAAFEGIGETLTMK